MVYQKRANLLNTDKRVWGVNVLCCFMFLSSWFRWSLSSETNPRVVSPGKSLLSCFMCHKEMRYEDSLGHRSNSAKVRIIQLEVCFNSTTTLEFVVAGCSRYGMVGPLEVTTPVHLSLLVTHANPELRKVLVFCCFQASQADLEAVQKELARKAELGHTHDCSLGARSSNVNSSTCPGSSNHQHP